MDKNFIAKHWYADIYEQQENQINDVELMLSIIGDKPLTILEACCGGGRILIPLAQAGHIVTGFDMDKFMLEKLSARAKGMDNITYFQADAVASDWGIGFDVVVLAGNLLLNIESSMVYQQAQQLVIRKAAKCLKRNGYMFLDFNYEEKPKSWQSTDERVFFNGTDDLGTYGRFLAFDESYDCETQFYKGKRRTEITIKDGEKYILESISNKYFPNVKQVKVWLESAGFEIKSIFGDYHCNPIDEKTSRAIIWAKKL